VSKEEQLKALAKELGYVIIDKDIKKYIDYGTKKKI